MRKLSKVKPAVSLVILLILLAFVFTYAMFQGGFVSWFLFFSFLPFALYSILLFFYPMKFQTERILPSRVYSAGDSIDVTLILTRKLPFPLLFLLIEDGMSGSLNQHDIKRMYFPGFKRRLKATYTIRNVSRGEHFFTSVRIKTGDALGLLEKEKQFPCKQTILVYPSYNEMFYKSFRSMLEQGGILSGTKLQNDASIVAGIREYIPGDHFSWIDWKASARSNEMMTKEFEMRESGDLLIILDLMPAEQFELLVEFAASAARTVLRNGGETGLFLPGKEKVFIPSNGGERQERTIFYHLAKVKPDSSLSLEKHFGEPALAGQPTVFAAITSRISKPLIDGAGRLIGQKGLMVIYVVKGKKEKLTPEETAMAATASGNGVIVHIVEGENWRSAFVGVKQA
ncbi:Uncharacterized conserved protein (some members contain a von Willebrand factor type A (vWA) domain) [Bacillus freudenreichii]|nr:Uncharacterized conserved protein (some members contain a von Willebrand factor type A (vWA) domain) [Bacillus freudenreichii]